MLCVIDMQPGFSTANDTKLMNAVIAEIRKSILLSEIIVIVEYSGYGKSHQSILDLVKKYQHTKYVKKSYNNGSVEIEKVVSIGNKVKICGVNKWHCVYVTGMSLASSYPNSSILFLEYACNGLSSDPYSDDECLEACKNIQIIEEAPSTQSHM
jgi:hypothetical protein